MREEALIDHVIVQIVWVRSWRLLRYALAVSTRDPRSENRELTFFTGLAAAISTLEEGILVFVFILRWENMEIGVGRKSMRARNVCSFASVQYFCRYGIKNASKVCALLMIRDGAADLHWYICTFLLAMRQITSQILTGLCTVKIMPSSMHLMVNIYV